MAKIFISYSRDSQDVIEELVQDLNGDGYETWFDQRLKGFGGRKWWGTILSEIRTCDIFVAALTPDSLESQACQRELKYADRLQKPLLPVRLSDKVQREALPHGLAELQWVDYRRQDKQAFQNLQRTIRDLPKAPQLPDPLPDEPPVPMSYLGTLRERIETDSPLEFKDQAQLVFELRRHFRDGGPAEEIVDLLERLKRRRELLANVQRDIDELLGDINRMQRGSLSSKEQSSQNDTPEEDRKDQVREAESEDGTGRELKLVSAIAECRRLTERVLNKDECWLFEIDPKNRFIVKLDASAATPCIMAKACLRIDREKARALKALGWKVGDVYPIKIYLAALLVGLTFGVALLSREVRDVLTGVEARRSWKVASRKDTLDDAAADLARALRNVAPQAKTILVRRQEAATKHSVHSKFGS